MKLKCDLCGKEFDCSPSRFEHGKTHCCSKECMNTLLRMKREEDPAYLNCTCAYCGKKFHLKQFHINRYKNKCCSMECANNLRKITMAGENNHQYGLKGRDNASWESDRRISTYGYVQIRCLDHPFRSKNDFVFEHRLIAEKYLLNEENSIEIDGNRYLKPEYVVHHKDMNRLNNDPSNLEVMTKSEHQSLHGRMQQRERDSLGRFT